MKVKIGKYVSRWVSNLHQEYMEKKYNSKNYDSIDRIDQYVEGVDDMLQWMYNHSVNIYLDRKKQKISVKIDKWDTWSMDHTLAPIILPMLKQLKTTNHGAPNVDADDVPKELRATKKQLAAYGKKGDVDPKHFERWDWIMDEMIWAFEQKCRDNWEEDYYGPYIESEDGKILGGAFEWADDKGRQAHQLRMTNGFKLFGKYFENLWD